MGLIDTILLSRYNLRRSGCRGAPERGSQVVLGAHPAPAAPPESGADRYPGAADPPMNRLEPHPSVVCTVLEEGGVLLHLETKYYYSLNRTALALWLHLESGGADPAGALAARFPEAIGREAALAAFLGQLTAERLAEARDANSPGTPGAGAAAAEPPLALAPDAAWEPPKLTRHDAPLNQILSNPFDPCVPLAE